MNRGEIIMNNFITNEGELDLKRRITNLVGPSKELKFLVGFFYFSGIRELYESLKDNSETVLKVLVGMNVDKNVYGLIEYADPTNRTKNQAAEHYFLAVSNSINSDDFDNQEFYEQVKLFVEMIKEDRLILRKTVRPNHSKLYLFKLNETQIGRSRTFITGSSNLTKPGLVTQNEFNVEISDYGFDKAEKYFDDLWSSSVKITESDDFKKRLIKVVETETHVKEITPFEAYVHLIKLYLDSYSQKETGDSLVGLMKKAGYREYKYQFDAIKQALSIIEIHKGVIIADVVGLGKTIIACAVAKLLRKRGIVICPPGLIGDDNKQSGWKMYLEQFGLYDWEVRSRGDLENILNFVRETNDIDIVIVDEAHHFRNQDTESYERLKNICRNKQVILLTATPFNNKPSDILALLKLFLIPKKSSITLSNDLDKQFDSFEVLLKKLNFIKKNYNSDDNAKNTQAKNDFNSLFGSKNVTLSQVNQKAKWLAQKIRSIMEPVTIRRNRLDLQNNPSYRDEVQSLSIVENPREWFFTLDKKQSEFYDTVITHYFTQPKDGGLFSGAIYMPFIYEKGVKQNEELESLDREDNRAYLSQANLFGFMRRLLVKRFESSFGAFKQSIENFIKVYELCYEFVDKNNVFILDRELLERIYDLEEDEVVRYLIEYELKLTEGQYPKNYKIYEVDKFAREDDFKNDIKADILLLKKVLSELDNLELIKNDPKTNCLVEKIKEVLNKEPQRKIIIFSEYIDTVKYLEPALKKHFGNRVLTIAGNLTQGNIKLLFNNFDASNECQHDDFDILLTTDKLSEGFNLNRAGMVINYDIPWNPVRVIQRLGRINRISKKVFDSLYIVNFFPTERGANVIRSKEIASNKMFMIHSVLGEDSKIFDSSETPTAADLYKQIQMNPDKLEQESFYTRVLNDYNKIADEHPDLIDSLDQLPHRIKVAKEGEQNQLFVFFKKLRLYVNMINTDEDNATPMQATFEEVYEKIKCTYDEKPLDWNNDQFWTLYSKLKSERSFDLSATSPHDIRNRALNNLRYLISHPALSLDSYKEFLELLKTDIESYGTLPEYTLRRIANFKENSIDDIVLLRDKLGKDYLKVEQSELKEFQRELIIAVENKIQ